MVKSYRYDPKKKRMVLVGTSARRVSVGLILGAKKPTINDTMAAGYKKLESAGKLKDHPNYLPVKAIKRALETPVP